MRSKGVQESVAEAKKPPLGSGERFKALSKELRQRGVKDPDALAASIGRKKYGKAKMAKMAAAGRSESAVAESDAGKQFWHVSAKVAGQEKFIGKVEATLDEIKDAFPYSSIQGNHVVVLSMSKKRRAKKAESAVAESDSRDAALYKAKDGRWYFTVANTIGKGKTSWGPFNSQKDFEDWFDSDFPESNPGGWSVDKSGKMTPPKNPQMESVEEGLLSEAAWVDQIGMNILYALKGDPVLKGLDIYQGRYYDGLSYELAKFVEGNRDSVRKFFRQPVVKYLARLEKDDEQDESVGESVSEGTLSESAIGKVTRELRSMLWERSVLDAEFLDALQDRLNEYGKRSGIVFSTDGNARGILVRGLISPQNKTDDQGRQDIQAREIAKEAFGNKLLMVRPNPKMPGTWSAEALYSLDSGSFGEGLGSSVSVEEGFGRRGGRGSGGDPRWMTAKYPGKASDGTPFKKGEEVLYYPLTKTFIAGEKAKQAWREFQSAKGDEEGTPYAW